jgi:hypothetical protein
MRMDRRRFMKAMAAVSVAVAMPGGNVKAQLNESSFVYCQRGDPCEPLFWCIKVLTHSRNRKTTLYIELETSNSHDFCGESEVIVTVGDETRPVEETWFLEGKVHQFRVPMGSIKRYLRVKVVPVSPRMPSVVIKSWLSPNPHSNEFDADICYSQFG